MSNKVLLHEVDEAVLIRLRDQRHFMECFFWDVMKSAAKLPMIEYMYGLKSRITTNSPGLVSYFDLDKTCMDVDLVFFGSSDDATGGVPETGIEAYYAGETNSIHIRSNMFEYSSNYIWRMSTILHEFCHAIVWYSNKLRLAVLHCALINEQAWARDEMGTYEFKSMFEPDDKTIETLEEDDQFLVMFNPREEVYAEILPVFLFKHIDMKISNATAKKDCPVEAVAIDMCNMLFGEFYWAGIASGWAKGVSHSSPYWAERKRLMSELFTANVVKHQDLCVDISSSKVLVESMIALIQRTPARDVFQVVKKLSG